MQGASDASKTEISHDALFDRSRDQNKATMRDDKRPNCFILVPWSVDESIVRGIYLIPRKTSRFHGQKNSNSYQSTVAVDSSISDLILFIILLFVLFTILLLFFFIIYSLKSNYFVATLFKTLELATLIQQNLCHNRSIFNC